MLPQEAHMARHSLFIAALMAALSMPLAAQTFSFNTGAASLDVTLNSLNIQAKADIGSYTTELSVSFGVKQSQIQAWMSVEKLQPAEVYLVLELGRIAGRPPASVIEVYRKNKGKGWGVVAKALGIKPGSPEFKALKSSAAEKNKKVKARKKSQRSQ
jgi:hypothetical protein